MKKSKVKNLFFWLFLSPILLAFLFVIVLPLFYGIYYSFTNWNGIGTPVFKGFSNYARILTDVDFRNSIFFTVKFVIASVIIINTVGLALALLVTQEIKGKTVFRTIFFMPNLIGGLILGCLLYTSPSPRD